MTSLVPTREVEMDQLREYFYQSTGVQIGPSKRYFLDKRVEACIRDSGAQTFAAWFAELRAGRRPALLRQLISELTVHETYFLREPHQFDLMINRVLPKLMTERVATHRMEQPVRILSLPCSTGEEPYSIALRLLEDWPLINDINVEIHGTDIDHEVVTRARAGVYSARSVQQVPPDWLARYFQPVGSRYQLTADIRSVVEFSRVNVCDPTAMRAYVDFDIIFCRNMLIYFDELSGRKAAENLYGALRPGGYLFLGHAESMSRVSPIFSPVALPEGVVYQRPTTGGPQ